MTVHPKADTDDEWMSQLCVAFPLFLSSDEQSRELLLHYSISTVCPAVENTLLWLNKLRSIAHTSHSRFISYSFFFLCSSLSQSSCSLFIRHHHPQSKSQAGIFRAGAANTLPSWQELRERSKRRNVYSFCLQQRGWAPCSALPLIVILSRPAQDTGDFIPWIFVCMDKQEIGSNAIQCFCLSANFLSATLHPTVASHR